MEKAVIKKVDGVDAPPTLPSLLHKDCSYKPVVQNQFKQNKSMKKNQPIYYLLKCIMKNALIQLCLVLLFLGTSLANNAKAQDALNQTISLSMQNSEIGIVINSIEKISKTKFVFSSKAIDLKRKVNVNFKDEKLKNILDIF